MSKYMVHEILYKTKLDKIKTRNVFNMFLQKTLQKKELHPLIVKCLIGNELLPSHYNYKEITEEVLTILKPYKNVFLDYILRPKFLKNNLFMMDKLFKESVESQEVRENIIDFYINSKQFKNLDIERQVYLLLPNLRNKNKYKNNFPNIEENKNQPLVQPQKLLESYIVEINPTHLVKLYPQYNIKQVKEFTLNIARIEKSKEKIGIEKILYLPNKENIEIMYLGKNLQTEFLKRFSNQFFKNLLEEKINDVNELVSYLAPKIRAEILEEQLPNKPKNIKVNKI